MPTDVPVDKLPSYLRDVPEDKLPANLQQPPQQEKPSILRSAYNFMGGAPGIGATGASIAAAALAPETGGLSLIVPALAAGGTAGVIDALQGGQNPLTTGVTTGLMDVAGGAIAKPLGWAANKMFDKFQFGKYVGNVGKKLGEVFDVPAMKTEGDIYKYLRAGEAEKALSDAFDGAQRMIFNKVPPDTEIQGPLAQKLNILFSNHMPEVKELMELKAQAATQNARPFAGPRIPMRPGQMTQAQIGQRIGTYQFYDAPLTVGDAIEYAKLLGETASRSSKGARGHAVRAANQEARNDIATALDGLAPGIGDVYSSMNKKYAQGQTVLHAFKDKNIFKTTTGGGKLDRVELQRASNEAFDKLKQMEVLDLDRAIRGGMPPGYTGTKIGGHVRAHVPFTRSVGSPGTWLNMTMENPLIPPGQKTVSPELLKKILGATGANIGARLDQ